MINVRLDDKELENAFKDIEKYSKNVKAKVVRQVGSSALKVESKTKVLLTRQKAVDTGRLRSSYRAIFRPDGLGAEVGTNVEYAPFIEFGTSRMAARPSLFPAAEQERPNYIKGISRALQIGN